MTPQPYIAAFPAELVGSRQTTLAVRSAPAETNYTALKSALDVIAAHHPDLDYTLWRNVVFAIHHATDGDAEGLTLAHEFSQKIRAYDPVFLNKNVWGCARADRENAITIRTIYSMAAEHGWRDPTIADDFDVIEVAQAATSNTHEITLIPAREVMRYMGPISWRVNNLLEDNSLGTLIGEPGAYKSFAAVDTALCVAAGIDWHTEAVKQGSVIYLAGEGHNGFARRMAAWGSHHRIDVCTLPFYKSSAAVPMLDKCAAARIERAVKTVADKHGAPALIVIDTLARNFGDGDENTAKDSGKFIEHIDRYLRVPTGATVLIVHHTGLAAKDRGRGSSSIRAATDFEYLVEKPEPLTCKLTAMRMKDAPLPPTRYFQAIPVPLDMDGANSLVLARLSGYTPPTQRTNGLGASQLKAFEALSLLASNADSRGGDNMGWVSLVDWRTACKSFLPAKNDRQRFAALRESLLNRRVIEANGDNYRPVVVVARL